jgi:hypothetical protein
MACWQRLEFVPDRLREPNFRQRIGSQDATAFASHQVLQRGRVEGLEHRFSQRRAEQRQFAAAARSLGGKGLQVSETDDLAARGDDATVRGDQILGKHRPGKGILHFSSAGPRGPETEA